MIRFHKVVASVAGIGYIGKGGGTIAAVVCCVAWYLIPQGSNEALWQVFFTTTVIVAGVWSGNVVEPFWGKDSSKVVIDEVAGMMVTLLFIPVEPRYVITGLVLFRFFDIVKPMFIKRMEALPGGWGVMGDDVLAGVYSNLILIVITKFNLR